MELLVPKPILFEIDNRHVPVCASDEAPYVKRMELKKPGKPGNLIMLVPDSGKNYKPSN